MAIYTIVCETGNYVLTGINVRIRKTMVNKSKVSTLFTNKAKNSTSFTNKAK